MIRIAPGMAQTITTNAKQSTRGRRARRPRITRQAPRVARDDNRAAYAADAGNARRPAFGKKWMRGTTQFATKAAARDQSERDARSERLYRSSQLSAPIITDAKACKRTGAHGESIYENCQLAPATGAPTD